MHYQYHNALQSDSDFQIHIKREPNACFINNFLLKGYKFGNQTLIYNQ